MLLQKINFLTVKSIFSCLLAVFYITVASVSHAGQTVETITADANSPIVKDAFEWQFMLDLAFVDTQIILSDVEQTDAWDYFQLGLLLDISYKGFFLQTNSRRASTALGSGEFGYQLTVQPDWQLDLIVKAYILGYTPEEILKEQNIPQLEGLNERNPTGGIALRYSHFFDDSIFYVDIATARAVSNDQDGDVTGLILDSFYSYLLPYRNWDIYLGAGLTYYDKAFIDYYIGIDADEVTSSRYLYEAEGGFRAQLEVYAQYPLSESWSFNAGVTQSFYTNNIKRSPLVDKNMFTELMIGVLYVF
jgi:outer membrane scaffolding protein for murein synthesis (MipA/OmpV family)